MIKFTPILLLLTTTIMLSSCAGKRDVLDPKSNMSYAEYDKKLFEKPNHELDDDLDEMAIPNITPVLAEPEPPIFAKNKLITLSVTEDVPLKEVLLELARLADLDMELDHKIQGGIILKVKDKPLSAVIERVCVLGNLRYSMNQGILKIEVDNNYVDNYSVDFINMVRSGKSSSTISNSLSASAGANSETGSNNQLTSSYEADLWGAVKDDILKILNYDVLETASVENLKTATSKPAITMNKHSGNISIFANSKQHKDIHNYLAKVRANVSSQVLIEAKVIEIELNDNYQTGVNWSEIERIANKTVGFTTQFNDQIAGSGAVMGFGKNSSNLTGNAMLAANAANLTNASTAAQAAVTAFTAANPADLVGIAAAQATATSAASAAASAAATNVASNNGAVNNANLKSLVQLTQTFGVTKSIASPRIQAMNNQKAILSFVTNQVYFTIQTTQIPATTTGNSVVAASTTSNSTLNSVPIGYILSLQPSINLETQEITMNIHPTITTADGVTKDPVNIGNLIPNVKVKEMDSVLKIKNGQVMVIGGLMEDRIANVDTGVPYLMNIPLFGNLVKSVKKTTKTVQTIIFIKATIIPSNIPPAAPDRKFYNDFGKERDSNPWEFRK